MTKKELDLEAEFQRLLSLYDESSFTEFSLEELRTFLAHAMWKDGMEWPDVLELWEGRNELYNERGNILVCLGHVFGYMKEDCEDPDEED